MVVQCGYVRFGQVQTQNFVLDCSLIKMDSVKYQVERKRKL